MSIDKELDKELEFLKKNKAEEVSKVKTGESKETDTGDTKESKFKSLGDKLKNSVVDSVNEKVENTKDIVTGKKKSKSEKELKKEDVDKIDKKNIKTTSDATGNKTIDEIIQVIEKGINLIVILIPALVITFYELIDDQLSQQIGRKSSPVSIVLCIIVIVFLLTYSIVTKRYTLVSILPACLVLGYILLDKKNNE